MKICENMKLTHVENHHNHHKLYTLNNFTTHIAILSYMMGEIFFDNYKKNSFLKKNYSFCQGGN